MPSQQNFGSGTEAHRFRIKDILAPLWFWGKATKGDYLVTWTAVHGENIILDSMIADERDTPFRVVEDIIEEIEVIWPDVDLAQVKLRIDQPFRLLTDSGYCLVNYRDGVLRPTGLFVPEYYQDICGEMPEVLRTQE